MEDQQRQGAIEEMRRTTGPFLLITVDRFLFVNFERDVDDHDFGRRGLKFLKDARKVITTVLEHEFQGAS